MGLKRAVIDHPFSPFLNLSSAIMKELAPAGILFNFTWDELSPLLGVDPQIMIAEFRVTPKNIQEIRRALGSLRQISPACSFPSKMRTPSL